jgi:hypothetical protein
MDPLLRLCELDNVPVEEPTEPIRAPLPVVHAWTATAWEAMP